METVIVHRILERGRIQRANLVCVKKKGEGSMLLCIRLVGKNLQKPHDSCIVSGKETEGVMRRRTHSRPQFGGLST